MLNSPVHGNLSGVSYKTDFICVSIPSEEGADWDLSNVMVLNHSLELEIRLLSSPLDSLSYRFLGQ